MKGLKVEFKAGLVQTGAILSGDTTEENTFADQCGQILIAEEENLERLKLTLKSNAALHGGGVSFGVLIKYDADNSFGASLRDEKICSHDSFTGEFGEYDDEDDVLIDGQKYLDWLRYN